MRKSLTKMRKWRRKCSVRNVKTVTNKSLKRFRKRRCHPCLIWLLFYALCVYWRIQKFWAKQRDVCDVEVFTEVKSVCDFVKFLERQVFVSANCCQFLCRWGSDMTFATRTLTLEFRSVDFFLLRLRKLRFFTLKFNFHRLRLSDYIRRTHGIWDL